MGAGEGGGSGGRGGREKWGLGREGGRYKSSALPPINKRPHTHNAAHLSTVSGSTMRYKQRGERGGEANAGRGKRESERAKIGREKRKRARKDDWWREGEMRMKEGG